MAQSVDGPHTQKHTKPWRVPGPLDGPAASAGLEQACKALHVAAKRPPTEKDAAVSTFPITPAAREALRLNTLPRPRKPKQ